MPDLVIGGRRAGPPRRWAAAVIALSLLGVAMVVAWLIYRRSVAYRVPPGALQGDVTLVESGYGAGRTLAYGSASLTWLGSLPVLHAAGDPHALGAAHGRLLAPWILPQVFATSPSIAATVSSDGLLSRLTHGLRIAWLWRFLDEGVLEQDRLMVAGMARGSAISGVAMRYEESLRAQAVLDVGVPSPRADQVDPQMIAHSLTLIGAQTQTPARLWIGRSFALPGLDDGGDAAIPVITIAKPDGKIAWAGVGWPGQLGVVTGINASGIAVLVDPARTSDVRITRAARPIGLLARSVLEQARTLEEAIKLIEGSPTLGSAVFVVVDGGSGKWAEVERTPSRAVANHSPTSPAIGDVLTATGLASDPDNDRVRRAQPTANRIERAARLLHTPLADAAAMAQILRDRHAADESQLPRGHRGAIDDGRAVHTVIIDPASLVLWVADPRAGGRMRALDLRRELRGEDDRLLPIADIPADVSSEGDRAELTGARADLRAARAAVRAGDLAHAAELCARARARAPSLPEAIELDAIVAQSRGNTAQAATAFTAWLSGGADDPSVEQAAHAASGH